MIAAHERTGAFPAPPGTPEERAALLADLLALARDWKAGTMPLGVLARQMTQRERYAARRAQPCDGSEDHRLLCRVFDALCRDGGVVATRQGVFLMDEWRGWAGWREAAEPHLTPNRYRAGR